MKNLKILKFPEDCTGMITDAGMHNLRYLVENYETVKIDLSKVKVINSDWLRWLTMMSSIAQSLGHKLLLTNATAPVQSIAAALGLSLKFE